MRNPMAMIAGAAVAVALAGGLSAQMVQPVEGKLKGALADLVRSTQPDELIPVTIKMGEQAPREIIDAARQLRDKGQRRELVVGALKDVAARTQGPVLAILREAQARGEVGEHIRALWIINLIGVEATPGVILQVAQRDDVEDIAWTQQLGEEVFPVEPRLRGDGDIEGGVTAGNIECGVELMGAPQVWNDLGITGRGAVVGIIDTGCCITHPDLVNQIWVNDDEIPGNGVDDDNNGFIDDIHGWNHHLNIPDVTDENGHGTHTTGTVAGDGAGGTVTGMAPDCEMMILEFWNNFAGEDVVFACHEYAIDNGADVVTASIGWPDDFTDREAEWRDVCLNTIAAGVVVNYAAGNEGACCCFESVRTPGDVPEIITCGATDCNDLIAGFSSRGPVTWQNIPPYNDCPGTGCNTDGCIKPTISAPGVSTVSCRHSPCNGYTSLSGTSMATPHVAGAIALMLEANPALAPEQVKQILAETAVLGNNQTERDNTFGWGRVDAFAAVELALSTADFQIEFPEGLPSEVDPPGGTTFLVEVIPQNSQPVEGSGLLHTNDGSGWVETPVNELGNFMYEAVFPSTNCPATVDFYISFESSDGDIVTNPFGAPANTYEAFSISEILVALEDDFEQDLGWTVVNTDLQGGAWERAVPIADNYPDAPARDFDGSGKCFVTGNLLGSGDDVDGGPTRLLSPVFDASAMGNPIVSYARWFSNSNQDVDSLDVHVSNDGGNAWVLVERIQDRSNDVPQWVATQWNARDFVTPTDQMRVRFSVKDNPNNSITEAAVDAFGVRDFVCANPAELVSFEIVLGTLLDGKLADLIDSDDLYVHTRSGFGATLAELHKLEMVVQAVTSESTPSSISIRIESRIDEPAGIGKVALLNRNTGRHDQVGTFGIDDTDGVDVISGIDATNYVSDTGEIESLIKHVVFVPFIAFEFESFFDHTEYNVN